MDEKGAIQILRKHATSDDAFEKVLAHSKALQKLALEVAEKIKTRNKDIQIDTAFIITASLLHDIGRFEHPPGKDSVKHGVAGADILRKEGLDERYARVCERHVGGGIPKKEVIKNNLPLPPKDYVPETIEERIITYSDNLLWGEQVKESKHAIKRFTDEIGKEAGDRVKKLHDGIHALMGK